MQQLLAVTLRHDQDVVTARQRAAALAQLLGFEPSEQVRVATAVSEIVRNAFTYARGGAVTFSVDASRWPQRLIVTVADRGPGIAALDDVLAGRYRSPTGLGRGIVGARRLMDGFGIESGPAGTTVRLEKNIPPVHPPLTGDRLRALAEVIARRRPSGLAEEIQYQNQELLRALEELQRKQQELARLNRELEDTNRGVVALYAELEERADHLRRADDLKSRFLSNMTHEFRTPVNAILGLTDLLLEDRRQEGRTPEPEIAYIRQAADQLSGLVNDLLDLAKVEAGKTTVRLSEFRVETLFGALRGMLRPLLLNGSVALVFDYADELPPLVTDEAKVSQILRNLISNALKFTERGEVRVSAERPAADGSITFRVADTGIGIAPEDQERIFDEFTQLEHGLQQRVRGTGLGLPLARRLAGLLGGTLTVSSEPGLGSAFTLTIPMQLAVAPPDAGVFEWTPDAGRVPLLVVDDAPDTQYVYEKILRHSAYQIYPAYTVREAELALERITPAVVLLDIVLDGQEAWDLLLRLRRTDRTARTPVIVVSSASERTKALALGADAYLSKPIDRVTLLETLASVHIRVGRPIRTLVIDDEEIARFLLRQALPEPDFEVLEADSGRAGLSRAAADRPDVILLDLMMPDTPGEIVLAKLQAEAATRDIPVVIVTSMALDEAVRGRLLQRARAMVPKSDISRGTLGDVVRAAAGRQLVPHERPG